MGSFILKAKPAINMIHAIAFFTIIYHSSLYFTVPRLLFKYFELLQFDKRLLTILQKEYKMYLWRKNGKE